MNYGRINELEAANNQTQLSLKEKLDEINHLNDHIKRIENRANEKSEMVETLTSQITNQKQLFGDQISQNRQQQKQQQEKVRQKE